MTNQKDVSLYCPNAENGVVPHTSCTLCGLSQTQYFVMLAHPIEGPWPVRYSEEDDDAGRIVLFSSDGDAHAAMSKTNTANKWGYEVYPWPH